jgi:hypothetical protein
MANTHIAHQANHMTATEHIPRQTFALALVKLTISFCDNTRRILTAMLQHGQGIVKP